MKKNETARLAFNVIEIAHVQNANITIIHNSHRLNGIQMFERPKKKVWARNIVTIWLDVERWMQPPTCLCILFMCIYINAAWKVTLFFNRTTANFPCSMFKAKPISEEKHTQKYQLNSCSTVKSHKYFLIRERSGSTVQNFIFTFPKIKWIISFGLSTMGHITQSNPNIPRRNIEIAIGMSN